MKRAVIFLNGDRIPKKRILKFVKKTDAVIAADGGVRHALRAGLMPDIVLGDFDSTPRTLQKKLEKKNVNFLKFPTDKDQTDSELAVNYVLKNKFKDILIFGFVGDRIDHMLATLLFLINHTKSIKISLFTQNQDIFVLKNSDLNLRGEKGQYVSLLPFSKNAKITTTGLKYKLRNQVLELGKTVGVSNEFLSKKAGVKVIGGKLLVIKTNKSLIPA